MTDLGRPLFIPKPGFGCYNVAEEFELLNSARQIWRKSSKGGKDDDGNPSVITRVH